MNSSTETVEGATRALERVDDIESGDGLPGSTEEAHEQTRTNTRGRGPQDTKGRRGRNKQWGTYLLACSV